ncbi:hypothetical protein QTG54_016401 [Skeletonema marinoi]|uniref:ABC transporter domain-containing protein n=1 Tax=Skeletonema marinoi TaxID=267567 RepID=A0AAD8XSK7_9STRA|nr:hypothetical protein QTG54_016401 [Skeletonema marinoi]
MASPRRQTLHLCALLICIKFVVIASSPGGGVLPPPPPPPPPPQRFGQKATSERSDPLSRAQVVSFESSKVEEHSSGNEETTTTSQSMKDRTTTSANTSDNRVSVSSVEKPATPSQLDDNASDAKSSHESVNRFSETKDMSLGGASDTTADAQQKQEQNQWEQQSYQFPNQQWNQGQNQPNQSWGQNYQQQQNHQQQQQYSQYSNQQPPPQMLRQQQQQQQQYPQYRQPRPQQQPQQRPPNNQLALYNRPRPTSPVGASASRFFSLAAKKLQSGIESVSETLDTNNLASSVTGLTSRIGSNINTLSGAITGGQEGLKPGGARRMGPPPRSIPPMMQGGPRAAGGPRGTGGPPPQRRQQQMPPQKMETPSRRPVKGSAGEDYAPPMSELYSFNKEMTDNVAPSMGADDDTDSDIEDDDDFEQQQQQQQTQSESTPLPFSSGTAPKQYPSEPPRPSQLESRRPSVPSSFPRSSSTQTTRRRYDDFDDYDDDTIGSKIKGVLGSVPIPRIPKFSRSSMGYDDGSWSDDESSERTGGLFRKSKPSSNVVTPRTPVRNRRSSINSANIPRPVSSLLEKRDTLLSPSSSGRCKSIGRSQASLDAIQLTFVLLAVREVVPLLLSEIASLDPTQTLQKKIRTATLSTIFNALEGWAPYAVAAAFLVSMSNSAWIQPTLNAAANEATSESASDAAYSQLYLRLISSLPMQSFSSDALRKATKDQVLYLTALARLRFFVTIAVTVVILSTVAVLRPAGTAILSAVVQLWEPFLEAVKNSPIDWALFWDIVKKAGLDLASNLHTLFQSEFDVILQQPLRVAVVVSLIGTMMAVSKLPALEKRRKADAGANVVEEDNEEEDSVRSLWSNIGSSSSSRLGILSSPLGVEGALQQFTKLRPDQASAAGILCPSRHSELLTQKRRRTRESSAYLVACQSILRNAMYFLSSSVLLSIPLVVYFCVFALVQGDEGSRISWQSVSDDGWVSLLNLASLLFFTHLNAGNAAHHAIIAADSRLKGSVTAFFKKLAETAGELQRLSAESSAGADFQAMMTASPTKGLVVSDFWAAHSSRKAWAVKGANVQVRNGEVVLVIGDDGAGKSRLLTGIAEHIFAPPKAARTTTYARGNMNIAGVDISKWDRKVLQKRVGVFLNDIRTVPDYASLMSGCTLEEIIEPISVVGGRIGPKERNSMAIAMKITGLGSKVTSRFPSKLSTVVSANEDKLKPLPTRPPAYPLSPSEWSRVMLTKVLAQLISGNENQQSSSVAVKKSMMGSILLLDDASALMNETDEGKLITALRSTGAAVLLTSNRWASGRFADRIVVVSDGQVVESGSHADLMSLGPERSVYARQWNEMM